MNAQVAVFGFTVLPASYTYTIPPDLKPQIGQLVKVPFGRKFRFGIVVALDDAAPEGTALKPLAGLASPSPLATRGQLDLAQFVADTYFVSLAEALQLMLPRFPKFPPFPPAGKPQQLLLFPTLRQAAAAQKKEGGLLFSHTLKAPEFDLVWREVASGQAEVVLGPRTALFAPFANLTKICIFQTESDVYKEERRPYYRALTLARALAKISKARLEAVSYNPRVQDEYQTKHIIKTASPRPTQVVDLRHHQVVGPELKKVLAKFTGQRILIFLNRKSENGPLQCRTCKRTSYTDDSSVCPNCGSADVKFQTFNLQTLAKKINPPAGAEVIWSTQQIFFEETAPFDLVAVLSTDTYLHQPSFTSSEKTFQMLTLLRRLVKPGGQLLVQTGFPDEPGVKLALAGDYEHFYREELKLRKETVNPPFTQLVKVTPPGKDVPAPELPGLEIFGPFPGKKSPYFIARGQNLSPLRDLPRSWKLDIDPLSI